MVLSKNVTKYSLGQVFPIITWKIGRVVYACLDFVLLCSVSNGNRPWAKIDIDSSWWQTIAIICSLWCITTDIALNGNKNPPFFYVCCSVIVVCYYIYARHLFIYNSHHEGNKSTLCVKLMLGSSVSPVVCMRAHVLVLLLVYIGVQHILTKRGTWRVSYKR